MNCTVYCVSDVEGLLSSRGGGGGGGPRHTGTRLTTFRRDLLTSTMFTLGGSTSYENASLVLGEVLRASNRA